MAKKNIMQLIDMSLNNLAPTDSFIVDLNYTIENINNNNKKKPSQTYKPSSLHCTRNMYFQRVGETQDEIKAGSELIGICESGTARHESIQEYITKMKDFNIDCEFINVAKYVEAQKLDYLTIISQTKHETKLYDKEMDISFLCDGIIKYKGQYYILEIKTESSFKFNARSNVDDAHKLQATCYSMCLGISDVMFLYENRDVCQKKAYLLKVTDTMIEDLVTKIETVESCSKKLTPPPKDATLEKKHCTYCNYKNVCRKECI
jgi:hypothetical protein